MKMQKSKVDAPTAFLGMGRHRAVAVMMDIDPDLDIDDEDGRLYLTSRTQGLSLLALGGVVTTVFLFAEGRDGNRRYRGSVPGGTTFDMGRAMHRSRLGQPASSRDAIEDLPSWDVYEIGDVRLHVEYDRASDMVGLYVVTHVPLADGSDDPVAFLGMTEDAAGETLYRRHRDLSADADEEGTYLHVPGSGMSVRCTNGVVTGVRIVPTASGSNGPDPHLLGGTCFGMGRREHRTALGVPVRTEEAGAAGRAGAPPYDVFVTGDVEMYVEYAPDEREAVLYVLTGRPE